MKLKRDHRWALALWALLVAFTALPAVAGATDLVGDREISIGNPKAAITIIEYGSVTCSHCAVFNATVLPTIKSKYVETGLARYVFKEFPINPREDAAGFLIARCAGPARYLAVTDALFKAQNELFVNHNLYAFLMAGAHAGGLSEEQMKACIADPAAIQAFNARGDEAAKVQKISGTPTVFVNGKRLDTGEHPANMADLDAAIRPLLGANQARPRPVVRRRPHP